MLAEPVNLIAFSADGKFLAAQTSIALGALKPAKLARPAIHVWNVPENREIAVLDGDSSKMAFSHDGKHLAFMAPKGSLDLIDLQTTKKTQSIAVRRVNFSDLRFAADGQYLFEVDTGWIRTWDLKAGRMLHNNFGHAGTVNAIVTYGNDGWISAGEDEAIIQWDGAGREVRRYLGSRGSIRALVLSSDGTTLYAAAGLSIHAWDVATGNELRTCASGPISCLALTPDSHFLVIGGQENVSVLDASSFKPERLPVSINGGESVRGLACSSNAQGFEYSFGNAIRSWDLKTGAELFRIDTNYRPFQSAIRASLHTNPFVVTRDGQRIIAPMDSGLKFVVASPPNVLGIWDAKTGRLLDKVESPLPILTIAAHPNGKECALGHPDGTIGLLDLEKKTVRKLFEGHRGGVLKLAYSRDGKTLASSSTDTTILLWKRDAKD